jgi:hypothetical protein
VAGNGAEPVPELAAQERAGAPLGMRSLWNGSAPSGEAPLDTGGASEAAMARAERRRTYAREYARRKRAEQQAAKVSARSCVECGRGLRAGAGKAAKFCCRTCRNTASRRKTRARLAGPPPVGETWPPAGIDLADQLRDLDVARRFAAPDRRQELAASIRRVAGELEQAKVSAMEAEGLAA